MVSASLVFSPAWLDFDCAVSEVVTTIALLFFLALSLSSLVARLIGFLATGFPHSSKVTFRLGPLPLLPRLPVEMDVLFPYFHRRGGRARTVPHRCHGDSHSAFRYFRVTCAGPVLFRSGCSTRLNVLLACFEPRTFVRPRGRNLPQFLNVASRVSIPLHQSFLFVPRRIWSKSLFARWATSFTLVRLEVEERSAHVYLPS